MDGYQMNWTTEVPKESGWYWVKITIAPEIIYLDPKTKVVWLTGEDNPRNIAEYFRWGDKLEIPK